MVSPGKWLCSLCKKKKEITFELGLMLYTVNRKEMLKNESIEKKS